MSRQQFEKWIFRIDKRHAMLVAILSVMATVGVAADSSIIKDAKATSEALSNMEGPQLLAVIALLSIAFAAWMFYRLTTSVQVLATSLATLSARLENRPCLIDPHFQDRINRDRHESIN